MPVDYTIASRNALANTPTDFTNMLAQYQMMGARAQQQQLAQMQMNEYARKAQAEQELRGLTPNFEDPRFAQQVFQYDPDFARNLYLARRRGEAESASTRESQTRTNLAQRKFEEIDLPEAEIRKEKLDFERQVERRRVQEQLAKADAASLDLLGKRTGMAQDILSRMDETNYPDLRDEAAKFDPNIGKQLGETYNQKQISTYLNTAESLRKQVEDERKRRMEKEEVTTSFPAWAPGYGVQTTKGGAINLVAPTQPMMPQNAMTPAPVMPQTAFTNAPPVQPAQPAAILGTPEYEVRRAARSVLNVAGYDPEKNVNHVADLIRDTPSSAFRAYAQQKSGAFKGEATPQMENVGRLNTIIDNMVLAAANNKLGGQVSDADVRLLKEAQAAINDPSIQPNQRLAAWDEVMRIKTKQAGYDYTPMTKEQIRGKPIIGDRQPAQADEESILTSVFGPKKR